MPGSARRTGGNFFPLCLLVLVACGQCERDFASPVSPVLTAAPSVPGAGVLQGKAERWLRLLGKRQKGFIRDQPCAFAKELQNVAEH